MMSYVSLPQYSPRPSRIPPPPDGEAFMREMRARFYPIASITPTALVTVPQMSLPVPYSCLGFAHHWREGDVGGVLGCRRVCLACGRHETYIGGGWIQDLIRPSYSLEEIRAALTAAAPEAKGGEA